MSGTMVARTELSALSRAQTIRSPPAPDTMSQPKSISLYCKNETSDKEYHAQLAPQGAGFVVNYQNGKRGGTLRTGTKHASPVSYEAALKAYEALVREKLSTGYTQAASGVAFQDTPMEQSFTGIVPQLLNAIGRDELEAILDDPQWMLQIKHDGERRLIDASRADEPVGINRRGLKVALPLAVANAVRAIGYGCVLDGELVGNTLHVFDLLELDGRDLREQAALDRFMTLVGIMQVLPETHAASLAITPCAMDAAAKRALLAGAEEAGLEGVAGKRKDSRYSPGRPASGGDQLKCKFWESATLVVEAISQGKRSVSLAGIDAAGERVALGNVTIPPNHSIPEPGAIVEVKYLYAYRNGSLFQPEFRGMRPDQTLADCTTEQLKFKAEPRAPRPGR